MDGLFEENFHKHVHCCGNEYDGGKRISTIEFTPVYKQKTVKKRSDPYSSNYKTEKAKI